MLDDGEGLLGLDGKVLDDGERLLMLDGKVLDDGERLLGLKIGKCWMDWMDTGKVVRVRLESAGWFGWTGERLDALIQGISG